MRDLRRRAGELMLPKKVAEEVMQPGTPLKRFLEAHREVIVTFRPQEENEYLRVLKQPGIDEGEAAAIAVALNRELPLVVEDRRGRAKAENHGIKCLTWKEWCSG